MHILKNFAGLKGIELVEPGELFVTGFAGGQAKAICLKGTSEEGKMLALILDSPVTENSAPFWYELRHPGTQVLSFGSDWHLDLTDLSGCFASELDVLNRAGVIFLDANSASMKITPPPKSGRHGLSRVDLMDFTLGGTVYADSETFFPNWRIWLRAEDACRASAKPFHEFKLPASSLS